MFPQHRRCLGIFLDQILASSRLRVGKRSFLIIDRREDACLTECRGDIKGRMPISSRILAPVPCRLFHGHKESHASSGATVDVASAIALAE